MKTIQANLLIFLILILASRAYALEPVVVDFDSAMLGVHFKLDGDDNGESAGNGIPDAMEMVLVSAVLKNPNLDLSAQGGVSHKAVREAYLSTLKNAEQDIWLLKKIWPTAPVVISGYVMLGKQSFKRINEMTTGFGASLDKDYQAALLLDKYLSANGDADGDGLSNLSEYQAHIKEGRDAYIKAALDPTIKIGKVVTSPPTQNSPKKMQVGILLYPGFEVLDVYGPTEMWAYVDKFQLIFIAEKIGPVNSAQGVATIATHSFETAPVLDVLLVPGGFGTQVQLGNDAILNFIRKVDKTTKFTTSVCTGSALLAKAGVLNGQRATSNKRFFYLAEEQSQKVNWVPEARWVESGKYFTSSGVSAGTDMALGVVAKLYDSQRAKDLASGLEYQWQSDSSKDDFSKYIQRVTKEEVGPAAFIKSEPAAKAVLNTAPQYIRLFFNKAPNPSNSKVALISAAGEEISLVGQHTMGANDLMNSVGAPLKAGVYTVKWTVQFTKEPSATNPFTGSYQFTIGAQPEP